MGVIKIFGGMGKILEFTDMLFIYLKVTSNKTVPDDIIHFFCIS